MSTRVFEGVPLPEPSDLVEGSQAVIELGGIDLAGPTSELRVFLNNEDAGPSTPRTAEAGYAGSIHVYGFGRAPDRDTGLPAPSGRSSRAPDLMSRYVIATEAVRRALRQGASAKVSIVPVLPGGHTPEEAGVDGEIAIGHVTIRTKDQ